MGSKPEPRIHRDENGCWIWLGVVSDGYGYVRVGAKMFRTHRLLYTLFYGAVPSELVLDHLCGNKASVNPEHLEPVTMRENLVRARGGTVGVCLRGHVYDEANTYVSPQGRRFCRACKRARYHEGKAA